MRSCIFCGAKAGNREHVIARNLIDKMGLVDDLITVKGVTESSGEQVRVPHKMDSLISKAVCLACNNGWMSKLESSFADAVGDLISEGAKFTQEDISRVREQGGVIASWLAKTAIIHDQISLIKKIVPDQYYADIYHDNIPEYSFVMMGHVEQSNCQIVAMKGFQTYNSGQIHVNQKHIRGYSFCVQLQHLILRLVVCPNAQLGVDSDEGRDKYFPVYPESDIPTPCEILSFGNINDFYDRLVVYPH